MAQLYLDEDLGGFAGDLRSGGHDVLSVAEEPGRRGKTDAWHFREAMAERRVLLTWNKDHFQYLHKLWTTLNTLKVVTEKHCGVLTADARRRATLPIAWIPLIGAKLSSTDPLDGRLWIWVSSKQRWVEDESRPEED